MSKYIGLTIGPIAKTLHQARKTREIWGASYLFSYLMKKIIKKLKDKDVKFVLPYLLRRVEENTSVKGQTSRELSLLKEEQKRRKL